MKSNIFKYKLSCHLLFSENPITPDLVSVMRQHKLQDQIVFCGLTNIPLSFWLKKPSQNWINQNYAQEVFQLKAMWVLCSGRDWEDREGVKEKQTADVIQAGGPSHPSPSRWLTASHCVCLTLCLCSHANCASKTFCITWKKCSCDTTAEAVGVCISLFDQRVTETRCSGVLF